MNTAIVDQHIVHLEVRTLAGFFVLEFNESILQRITGNLISDHLTSLDLPEPAEDNLQIVIRRHRVELANKQNILRWSNFRIRNVPDNLQDRRPGLGFLLGQHFGNFLRRFPLGIVDLLISSNPPTSQSLRRWRRGPTWLTEPSRIIEGILQYHGVRHPNILIWPMLLVTDRLVQLP